MQLDGGDIRISGDVLDLGGRLTSEHSDRQHAVRNQGNQLARLLRANATRAVTKEKTDGISSRFDRCPDVVSLAHSTDLDEHEDSLTILSAAPLLPNDDDHYRHLASVDGSLYSERSRPPHKLTTTVGGILDSRIGERCGSMSDVTARHNQRIQGIDPLVGIQEPLPAPTDTTVELRCEGGHAAAHFNRINLDSFLAAFSAEENHQLKAHVDSPRAMEELLRQWEDLTRSRFTANPDAEISLSWPSRDVDMTRVFKRHFFSPGVVVAARRSGMGLPSGDPDVTVRAMERDDLDVACDRWEEVVNWDNQFLDHPKRPTTRQRIRETLVAALDEDPWTWVAERGGQVVGLLHLVKPMDADWIAPTTSASPICYLMCLGVTPTERGGGVGTTLVRHAHRTLEYAGLPMSLLHYNSWNPLSGPFWHRMGYRPLSTTWIKSPQTLRLATSQ